MILFLPITGKEFCLWLQRKDVIITGGLNKLCSEKNSNSEAQSSPHIIKIKSKEKDKLNGTDKTVLKRVKSVYKMFIRNK
jgi:hypothetical protein